MSAEWTGALAAKHPQIQFLNASSSGIEIPSVPKVNLAEVSEGLQQEWDLFGMMHALCAQAPSSQVSSEKVADVRNRVKESFEKSLGLCDELLKVWEKYYPHSPLEKAEYALLEHDLEHEIAFVHFVAPLWSVWQKPILRSAFHPLGQHVHKLLFFKKALETHLPHLRSYS